MAFVAIKEHIRFEGPQDIQTKVMTITTVMAGVAKRYAVEVSCPCSHA